jgi:hypothetical protein
MEGLSFHSIEHISHAILTIRHNARYNAFGKLQLRLRCPLFRGSDDLLLLMAIRYSPFSPTLAVCAASDPQVSHCIAAQAGGGTEHGTRSTEHGAAWRRRRREATCLKLELVEDEIEYLGIMFGPLVDADAVLAGSWTKHTSRTELGRERARLQLNCGGGEGRVFKARRPLVLASL